MRAHVYERLSPRPCTFNFVCVPKCVYLWPVLRFRFAPSLFLAVSFFLFFFYTHTRHVGATSKWSSEGQLGVWLKSGEARCAVRGLAGVAVLEIRPCVPRLVMENPFKGETLLARVDEKLGSLPSPQTRLFWAWYFLKKRTIVSQTKWRSRS